MKFLKFREILHTIANKGGFDPEAGNFLTNQAIPIGRYIDQWVRRLYDGRDWPELVLTREFEPENHLIPWEGDDEIYGERNVFRLGRVLKAYLVDPRTTAAPVSTDYQMLMSGVHVGHEHGTSVWLRYMFPPPRFTCEVWDADTTYAKDAVVYSPQSGECYRSKVYSNRAHDPARSFQLPPFPPDMSPVLPESDTPPDIEVLQDWIPDDPGFPGQTQIIQINVQRATFITPPDPATALDVFSVEITDADDVSLGIASAVGPQAQTAIVTELVSELTSSLPAGFTVVVDPTNAKLFTVEHLSAFRVVATYTRLGVGDSTDIQYQMNRRQVQVFIESRPTVIGQPQITRITMTPESTIPGAVYTLSMGGPGDSVTYQVEYQSLVSDNAFFILVGLSQAIADSTEEFWEGVGRDFPEGADGVMDIHFQGSASVSVAISLGSDPWWEWNVFPQVLAEPVIEGALADLQTEWGQTDKAGATKGGVPADVDVNATEFAPTPNPPLSGQQVPTSRYRA